MRESQPREQQAERSGRAAVANHSAVGGIVHLATHHSCTPFYTALTSIQDYSFILLPNEMQLSFLQMKTHLAFLERKDTKSPK